ncbi:response regulator transcription factor [Mucilaginibacter sp.]|jgi:DNA-binding NarL/FixJ family response regulator|uniref:response regulator transcription factor n=1 Tax=Mucilaginibacter sp. TaxID=1882438 RepID=UPI002B5E0187|nr:response regulator transcription factor [Mucilaginibacter sp.]HTI60333.1 response regulator transcription factor [Mucilaginibacter sp.]
MEAPIQIALVDDHRLFRSGIAYLINNFHRYSVLFEAGDGEEMIKKIQSKLKPDIILLDISMPKMDGISTARWLRTNHPDIKIIVLSMFEDAEKVLTMVRMGVKGYLLKDSEPVDFEDALMKVANDEIYYPDFVTRHLVHNINIDFTLAKLNSREIEFLKLSATELTYKEIAEHMCISSRTVDGYRDQLFEKLQIKSRIGLVLYAIKNKLIDV